MTAKQASLVVALAFLVTTPAYSQVPAVDARGVEGFRLVQEAKRNAQGIAEAEGPYLIHLRKFWKDNAFSSTASPQAEYERLAKEFGGFLKDYAAERAKAAKQRLQRLDEASIDKDAKGTETADGKPVFQSQKAKAAAIASAEQGFTQATKEMLDVMSPPKGLPHLPMSWAHLANKSVLYAKEAVTITQVLDEQNALATKRFPNDSEVLFWLSNVSLEGVADGDLVEIHGVFLVDGTKSYNTLAGTNTVRVLKRVPIETSKFYTLPAAR